MCQRQVLVFGTTAIHVSGGATRGQRKQKNTKKSVSQDNAADESSIHPSRSICPGINIFAFLYVIFLPFFLMCSVRRVQSITKKYYAFCCVY